MAGWRWSRRALPPLFCISAYEKSDDPVFLRKGVLIPRFESDGDRIGPGIDLGDEATFVVRCHGEDSN